MDAPPPIVAIAFSGGLGLAPYHAGVYETFECQGGPLHWVSGSSAGAVTAALVAGSPKSARLDRLKTFWRFPPSVRTEASPWRHVYGWMAAIETRLVGSGGFFRPRLPALDPFRFRSFYDLAPMKERLTALIDFARLNSGELRVSVAATDLETGEPVIFDSAHTKLEMDHLLASCGFLPEFAPVEVDGRLLGDGGLSINTPFDPILEDIASGVLLLYVVDLYARDGPRPTSFEAAAERKNDLLFANQTFIRLGYLIRARALQMEMEGGLRGSKDRIFLLSYRPGIEEPGPEKSFDLSTSAFAQRWNAGRLDMEHAQTLGSTGNLTIVRRQSDGPSEMGS